MAIYHDELSENLQQNFKTAVDLAIDNLYKGHETIYTFMLLISENDQIHKVFVNDSTDIIGQGLKDAKEEIKKTKNVITYIIGYEGSINLNDGSKVDAIILEGAEKNQDFGFIFAQRFRRNNDAKPTLIIGNDFICKTDQLIQINNIGNKSIFKKLLAKFIKP